MMAEKRKWSKDVTEHSDALDLKDGVFKLSDPKRIAASLKNSAEHSDRRKSDPYRSAMSMLTFYINHAGDNLPAAQHKRLEKAKDELRTLYDRPPAAGKRAKTSAKPAAKKTSSEKPQARPKAKAAAPARKRTATASGRKEKRS
jgi:hypothetical protein